MNVYYDSLGFSLIAVHPCFIGFKGELFLCTREHRIRMEDSSGAVQLQNPALMQRQKKDLIQALDLVNVRRQLLHQYQVQRLMRRPSLR